MTFFRDIYSMLDNMSDQWRAVYIIAFAVGLWFIGWLVSLTHFWWWLQLLLVIAIIAVVSTALYSFKRPKHTVTIPEKPNRRPQIGPSDCSTQQIPQVPDTEGKLGDEEMSQRTYQVLKQIAANLDAEARDRADRKRQEEERKQHRRAVTTDNKVRYRERPGVLYFIKRDLWQIILLWLAELVIVYFLVMNLFSPTNGRWLLLSLIVSVIVCVWYSIRCYGDWAWYRREIRGNDLYVIEPKNAFFLLNGRTYRVSVLGCDHIVMYKSLFERITRWPTATISINTRLEDGGENEVADIFKNMKHMRSPQKFEKVIRERYNALMFSQSDTHRRSDL